jgi:DNA repair protein RadC
MRLNEEPAPHTVLDTPETVVNYLTPLLPGSVRYSPETENLMVVYMNTRKHPITWAVISNGTLDTLLVHAREVFRGAIVMNAASIVLVHNHPSGDPTPSDADVKITRDLIKAGQLLKIELIDHIVLGAAITGHKGWASLRELGYFY